MALSFLSPSRLKQRIQPHLRLRVPYEAGLYGSSARWSNKDLDPVPVEQRTWGGLDYWAYWTSDLLAPPLAATVSTVMTALGFTARETLPIVFFGFLICSVVVTLTGKMGAKYHVAYPVIVRAAFGMTGSYPAIVIRAFVALMWTAILCVQAGGFLQNCIEAIWPSFKNFPNKLPESAGITSAELLCFMLYWIFQTCLCLMPIQKLRILFLVKAVIVPPTFLALFLWAIIVTKGGGTLVTGKYVLKTDMGPAYSALTGLNVMIGLFSSMAVNMPDFGRFSKNNLAGGHQFLALPIVGTLGALTPIFVTSAHNEIWGTVEWYMPAIIGKFDSRAAKFFTGASFVLATIGNQIAAGSFPFSNDVSGMAPKYINIFRGTMFISIFCVISTPWNIIRNGSGLLAFLSGYSCMMGPLAGTIVSDYYLVRKRKLDIRELYRDHGIYWYSYGCNWRAFASFLLGFLPTLPGFAKSIDPTLNVGGAWKLYSFAWMFGFTVSVLSYWVICTYISPPTESLVDIAVLPPGKSDEALVDAEQGSASEKAVEIAVGEKEMSDSAVGSRDSPSY